MPSYRQSKFNRHSRGNRRYRERIQEDIPAEPTHRLLWACYYGDLMIAREALQDGANINGKDEATVTPLLNACKLGGRDLINLLLDRGADPGLATADGTTPLHILARRNDAEMAENLIRRGADPAPKNAHGLTPVDVALEEGNDDAAIAIRSMISLAHSRKAKIIRFSNGKKPEERRQRKFPPVAKAGLSL